MIASPTFRGPYYGRVMPDGNFFTGKDYTEEVGDLLSRMAKDPKKASLEQGRLTGRCCFCRKLLSEEKSTKLGYGPVCATKFGLSHTKEQSRKAHRLDSGDLFTDPPTRKRRKVKVVPGTGRPGKREAAAAMSKFLARQSKPKAATRRIIRRNIEEV
jgi:hypothetical protein